MDQLQSLAESIAETYVRDLRRETGSNVITVEGKSGSVDIPLLAAGLVGNALLLSQKNTGITSERDAFWILANLIILDGPEYSLTAHATSAITKLTEISLSKQSKPVIH
ncbi:hypothetical protein [Buttiauxella noackiae]|uniref:hypothetical protein n=1 Tax=Buttiauxella noackiae TaxID=82992 RepID=UPI0028D7D69E|nr:hypothetical protein [Buttiauxella noackiae]